MNDKDQLLTHRKPLGDENPEERHGSSLPSEPSIAPVPNPTTSSSDNLVARPPDSHDCRVCLAAMAHRLAQPMTALRGGLELGLLGKRSAADYRTLLEQSLELADSMAQMIISLRDLGESGAPSGPPQWVLLEEIATEALAEMESWAQSRELHLQLNAAGSVKVCVNPERLREALLNLLAWVIQNSAGGVVTVDLSAGPGEAIVLLSPPRLDWQYLQVKVLTDITNPGLLFSHAAKNGALGWVINQRLLDGLGGKLEMLTEGQNAGCLRIGFPLARAS